MDNKDQAAPAPEASDLKAETPVSSGPAKVTRRSFLAGGLAAVATLFGRKDASAATPPQNMVAGSESVRMEPGAKMADSTTDIRSKDFAARPEMVQDKGSQMANSQLDVQGEPGQRMAADTENVQDKGSDMAQDQERVQKDFAGSAERVQDEGPNGGNDASVDSNGEAPVEPVLPPQDEAKV